MGVLDSCRRLWPAYVCCCLGLIPVVAFADSDAGTITVGSAVTESLCFYGYPGGTEDMGSYSPTGLTGGETVHALYDQYTGPHECITPLARFEVSGFSSNPGQSWLTSVTCNGVTMTGAAAAAYSYGTFGSGVAEWDWRSAFGFILKVGAQLSCTIVHS